MCKFLINNLCVGVFTIDSWSPSTVKLWLFSLVFQMIERHHQQQNFQLNFDCFLIIWIFSFNAVSSFLIYSISVSRQHIVSAWWVNFHINVFIICVLTKLILKRECKNVRIHVRSLSTLFAKFVISANSVSHN